MPELPEVETIKNFLANSITGLCLQEVLVLNSKLRFDVPESLERVVGSKITQVKRRAKYLAIFFDNDDVLLAHLGMSGSMLIYPNDYQAVKHDHILWFFDQDICLVYNDPRKFGFIDLTTKQDLHKHKALINLGVEPLEEELSLEVLCDLLKAKLPVKNFLMNNAFIVGIGNIYASEILFRSKIHPLTLASSLNQQQALVLLTNIKLVLQEAIISGGSTIRNFAHPSGERGNFASDFCVYGRHDKQCCICGQIIQKLVLAGRSTFFCPSCQPDTCGA